MKSASTNDRTEFILYDILGGARSKPLAKIEYYDENTSTWIEFADIKNLSLGKSNVNKQYGKFILVPPSNTLSAGIDNKESKYSPGTGNEFDGVLQRNLKVRVWNGYEITQGEISDYVFSPSSYERLYHSQVLGNKIYSDIDQNDSFLNLPDITDSWVFYGDGTYGDYNYQNEGYFLSDIIEFDSDVALKFLLIDSDSTKIDIWYRASNTSTDLSGNSEAFTLLGSTISGTKTFTLPFVTDKYFQIAIVFHTGEWESGYVENIKIQYTDITEYFSEGEYLLDDPSFSANHGNYSASFSARDKFKKAFETQINTPDYSSQDVAEVIRDIVDRMGIEHNDGNELIADTGYTVTISTDDTFKNIKAIDALNECMLYLNSKNINYRLELNDNGYLQLVLKDTTVNNADWQIDYRWTGLSISKKYESDKLLQRVTIMSESHTVDEEIQLATQNYTTAGNKTLSWSGDAIYKRITITEGSGNDAVFTLTKTELDSIELNISTGSIIDITVTIDGDKLTAGFIGYAGEDIYYNNQKNYEGFTQRIINRLIQSDEESRVFAEKLIDIYGNPEFKVTIRLPANPLLELGDKLLIWEKYTNTKTIYRIDKISLSYNAEGARYYQTLQLSDMGSDLDNFQWDRHNVLNGGMYEGIDDLKWDTGLLWDQDLGINVTEDTTDYENTRKVLFT
ncbi:MAG: hypothetical protein GWP19_00390 [Planctomycetia bacterium]|nr:hypothetical protein [Planctomycetia bacterium]